jgi:hypothetical protein
MIHVYKELNEGRPWNPRFRRPHRFSTTTTVTKGDEFISGTKMSGFSFVAFGRMISIYMTRKIKFTDTLDDVIP